MMIEWYDSICESCGRKLTEWETKLRKIGGKTYCEVCWRKRNT